MNRKIRIGVDCDGVLSDLDGLLIEKLNLRSGEKKYTKEMRTTWSMEESLNIDSQLIWDIMTEEGFCSSMKVLPDAEKGLDLLYGIPGSEVFIVTSPVWTSRTWMNERVVWLSDNLGVDPKSVIQAFAKHVIDLDVLIDDKPSTIEKWCSERRQSLGILWQRRYNENEHRPIESLMTNDWKVARDEIIKKFSIKNE